GKLRWIGVSNFDVSQLERARAIAPVTSLQPPYSLLHREVEAEVLPYCEATDIGVIAYSPMASGLLSGAMTRERAASLPPDDWRKRSPDYQEPRLSRNLRLAEKLRGIGRVHGLSPGATAVAWVLGEPAVTGAIVGARRPGQFRDIVAATRVRLGPDEVGELGTFLTRAAG
ncbi:MAG TPA: aldo/keto reductase, partial [Gemmataceae bacterium]|nr:aldo/keto reductase [Gemmataceae bacterium]